MLLCAIDDNNSGWDHERAVNQVRSKLVMDIPDVAAHELCYHTRDPRRSHAADGKADPFFAQEMSVSGRDFLQPLNSVSR